MGWESFGWSSSFCSIHFILFLNVFVYFYLVNFYHRDLDHGSDCDVPLSLRCGICSSLSFRASVTEVKVLHWSVRGCLEIFYEMCSCVHVLVLALVSGSSVLSPCASLSSLKERILQFMYRKKYALLQLTWDCLCNSLENKNRSFVVFTVLCKVTLVFD